MIKHADAQTAGSPCGLFHRKHPQSTQFAKNVNICQWIKKSPRILSTNLSLGRRRPPLAKGRFPEKLNGTGGGAIMKRRFLFGLSSSLIICILTALTGALPVQTIAAEEQRREPILIPGVQEPDEMRVEPFPVNNVVLTAPELMLGEAMESADKNDPAALLPALNQILAKYPDYSDGYVAPSFALCGDNDALPSCPASAAPSNS
jgi:hypothetical protein